MSPGYDLAIVGSGFGGSILAMVAARLGLSVILLEKGTHPRFVIGESSTPLSNLLLEELAARYNLPALASLTKWGSWQRSHPDLACGLKRGFSFFHHDLENPPSDANHRLEQLLVAASPNDGIADTHWYRADLDHFLVEQAQAAGVNYVDQLRIERMEQSSEGVLLLGSRDRQDFAVRARFVVDATGPRGLLHRLLHLPEAGLPGLPATQALYSHFSGVTRLDSLPSMQSRSALYPIDDAAVHHVFDGGWVWMLRFNNGLTSAGVAATAAAAERLGLGRGEQAWTDLVQKIPVLKEQFSHAKPEQPFTFAPKLSFRSAEIVGDRWALLPSSAGFVDPLLSTGFALTLLGVSRLAEIFESHWRSSDFAAQLASYASKTTEELLATSRLIGALYRNMDRFAAFRSLSLLYFAAASFSETARRLQKPDLAQSFLLHDRPGFGDGCRALLDRLAYNSSDYEEASIEREVYRLIGPIDVAGLGRKSGDFSYPVLAHDLVDNAWKLGATRGEALELLERTGFYATPELV